MDAKSWAQQCWQLGESVHALAYCWMETSPASELAMDAVLNWMLLSVEEPAVLIRTAMLPRLLPVNRLGAGRTIVLRIETAAL